MAKADELLNFIAEVEADPTLQLDPDFWDDKNKLRPEIDKVLQEVQKDVLKKLKDKKIELEPYKTILTGSLTSVNYDAASDVDFHILVDYSQFNDPELMKLFLAEFARNYNGRFDLRGRNIELYFQDAFEPHVSPGIYDVTNDTWIMPPSGEKIVRTEEMQKAAEQHLSNVKEFAKEWKTIDKKDKPAVKAFMMKLSDYFEALRKMRKDGIAEGGLASVGNQVFKLLRRNKTFEILTGLIQDAQDEIFEA